MNSWRSAVLAAVILLPTLSSPSQAHIRSDLELGLAPLVLALEQARAPSAVLIAQAPTPNAKAAYCKTFLQPMAGGMSEDVVLESVCLPGSEPVWALVVRNIPDRKIAARVISDQYPEQRALIERRLQAMRWPGQTKADIAVVVNEVGPLLKRAAAATTPEEKDAFISSAVKILKDYLARP